MILHLSKDVNYETFNALVKAFNALTTNDCLHIYFTCPEGGLTDVSEAIIDFINKNKDYIGMTFYGELFSSGMVIFLSTQCEKKILPFTRGMYHLAWQQMDIAENGKPSSEYDIFSMKEMRKSKEKNLSFLKTTKLSEKEINAIRKGKDVYFSYDRMLELL